jgi:hypothetical protein
MDLSEIAVGGYETATVIGLVIQELDVARDAVFTWKSWDHFLITDTYASLTSPGVDYVHANAIEEDDDGNLLISSRHMSEITKIDRSNGDIIWRLGGKNNQFDFIDDLDGPFSYQHDIRRQPNGNITLFDNHNLGPGSFSRAVEYELDEVAITKTATLVWQYRNTPDDFANAMGSVQRLPDGHTFIGWGAGIPNATEVLTDGTKLFEMRVDPAYRTYRQFRFEWSALPAAPPALVVITDTVTPTLHYSWNGATDVAYYEILAGRNPQHLLPRGTQARTAFEDQTPLTGLLADYCAFQIRPIREGDQPGLLSNVVVTQPDCVGDDWFLPVFLGP